MNWSDRYDLHKAIKNTLASNEIGDDQSTINNYMNVNSIIDKNAEYHYGQFTKNPNGLLAQHHLNQVNSLRNTLQTLHGKINFPSLMKDVDLSGMATPGKDTGKVSINEEHSASSGPMRVIKASEDELDKRYGPDEEGSEAPDYSGLAKENGGSFLTARVNGQLVGGVGISNMGNNTGEIRRLWVHPGYRGQGIAANLMSSAIDKAKSMGHKQLYLETGWAQPEAQKLYASTGWTPTDTYPDGHESYSMSYRFKRDI